MGLENIKKTYIGDGVYVDFENGMVKLTTEDGISIQNTIYLEPEVYQGLTRFVDIVQAELMQEAG